MAQSQGRAATKLRERLAEIIEQRTEGEKKLVALQVWLGVQDKEGKKNRGATSKFFIINPEMEMERRGGGAIALPLIPWP